VIAQLALALLVTGGDPASPGGERARREPVRLLTDFDEPRLVGRLRALLVGALPIFERETGRDLPEDEVLVLNLYRDLGGYQRGARAAGVTGFMNVGAVTAWSNQESFLALQPRADAAYLEAAGWLPDLTAQLALHELAHQFIARARLYPRLALPSWYSEGVADHLAELALTELVYDAGGRCLMLEDARQSVAQAVAEDSAIPLEELFTLSELELDAHASRDLFYDQSAAVVRFLAGDGLERWGGLFQGYLDELARAGRSEPGLEFLSRRAQQRERWLELVADLPALEAEWRGAVAPAAAAWVEREGSSQWVGEDVLVAALAWQDNGYVRAGAPAPLAARRFEGQFRLLELDGGEAFVVLHEPQADEGGLKLSVRRDGFVALVGWAAGRQDTRGGRSAAPLGEDGFVRVTIEVEDGGAVVRLDEHEPVRLELPRGFPAPGGAWGVGAWRDAALWRGARLR